MHSHHTSDHDDVVALLRDETAGLYAEPAEVTVDREEITVVGRIAADDLPDDATPEARRAAESRQMAAHREETRHDRIRIARVAEARYDRAVSWGVRCGVSSQLFTHVAAPVMTRLRQRERRLVDTLVEAGVARSRSEAVAWCLGVVADREGEWLADLQEALVAVREARGRGPQAGAGA